MNKLDIKSGVLQKLIDMMDEKESEGLKGKSPKFMKVEANDPEMAQEVVKDALDNKFERKSEESAQEDASEPNEDDDMQRMMELMSQKFSKR